ncbi:MAG: hypothetical protein Q9212_005266 [Teloschistes hypoglaucus]
MLVLGRCLQGCSVSIVFTVGLALLVDTVEREEIGQWIGFVLSGMNMGVMISPFLGGLVYEKAGYYAVCAMGLGVIAVDLLLRLVLIERKHAQKYLDQAHPDSTIAEGFGTFRDSSSTANRQHTDREGNANRQREESSRRSSVSEHDPHSSVRTTEDEPLLSTSQAVAPPCTNTETKQSGLASQFPVLVGLLRSPKVWTALYGALLHLAIITSFDAILPRFVNFTFGWGSLNAGLIFLAISLPSLLGGLFGTLSDRWGPRFLTLIGFAVAVPPLGLLALVRHDGTGQIVLLCFLLALIGTGLNMLLAPLASEMSFVVEEHGKKQPGTMGGSKSYAQAYSLFNCALAGGQLVGPTLAGLLYHQTNWTITVVVLAAFCASGAVPVVCFQSFDLHQSAQADLVVQAFCTSGPAKPSLSKGRSSV